MTLVKIKKGHSDQTGVNNVLAPFPFTGSTELIKTAREAGAGASA